MRITRRTALGTLALLAFMAGGATSAPAADPPYRTFRPDGAGPFPPVLFVSGCSGFAPAVAPNAYLKPAERLRAQGYLVVFVDYLGARNLKSCVRAVTIEEVGRDILAAVAWARSQPVVDPSRMTVIGWSWGGGGVLSALDTLGADQPVSFRAVVYYPVCQGVRSWKAKAPLLMLLGGLDDVAPAKPCQELAKTLPPDGLATVQLYPEARHGFDGDELPPAMRYPAGTLGHHPESAAAAWAEVERFLRP